MAIPAEFKDELARVLAGHLHVTHDKVCLAEGCGWLLREWGEPEDWDEKDWVQHRIAYLAAKLIIHNHGRATVASYLEIRKVVVSLEVGEQVMKGGE